LFSDTRIDQRRPGLQTLSTGSCNFLTDSRKFATDEIMGAQNFNFAPKLNLPPRNGEFSAPKFIFGRKLFDNNFFSTG